MTNLGWKTVKLKDVVSFKTGKLNSNAAVPDGTYPFFTCSQETFRTNTYSFDTECVLLAGNNAAGIYPLKYYKGKFDAYQRTYVIRTLDSQRLINRYLYYTLEPKLELLKSISTGAATKFLTLRILNDIEVDLPPLPTQRKIAAVLSAYDDLIENNTRRIAILEEMAQTLYREWFVHYRFPGHEAVPVVESELGPVPEGWEVVTLRDICELVNYGFTAKAQPEEIGPKFLRITDIVPALIDWESVPHCEIDENKIEKYLLKEGDIVIARTGATVGYAKRIGKRHPQSIFASYLVRLRIKEDYSNSMIGLLVESDHFKSFVNAHRSGAAQPQANAQVLTSLKLVLPPEDLQNRFDEKVKYLFNQKEILQQKNTTLRRTRDLLLPRLISGEVDVSELEIMAAEG